MYDTQAKRAIAVKFKSLIASNSIRFFIYLFYFFIKTSICINASSKLTSLCSKALYESPFFKHHSGYFFPVA